MRILPFVVVCQTHLVWWIGGIDKFKKDKNIDLLYQFQGCQSIIATLSTKLCNSWLIIFRQRKCLYLGVQTVLKKIRNKMISLIHTRINCILCSLKHINTKASIVLLTRKPLVRTMKLAK